ncbi:hypothetical protein X975_09397, partial [Stegodyphus mimosarum]
MALNERSYVKLEELPEILHSSVLGIIPIGKCSQYLVSVIEESNLFLLENGEIKLKIEAKRGLLTNACNDSEEGDWSMKDCVIKSDVDVEITKDKPSYEIHVIKNDVEINKDKSLYETDLIKSDVQITEDRPIYEIEVDGRMLSSICNTSNKENTSVKDCMVRSGSETLPDINEDKISDETATDLTMLTNAHDYNKEEGMPVEVHLIKHDNETSLEINTKETSFKTEANHVMLTSAHANNPGEDMFINYCGLKNGHETSSKNTEDKTLYETEAYQRMLNSEFRKENVSMKDCVIESANEASFEISKDEMFCETVVEQGTLINACDNKGENMSLRECLVKNGSNEDNIFYNIEVNQGILSNAYDNCTKETVSLEDNGIKSKSTKYIEIDENKVSCSNIEADQSMFSSACHNSKEESLFIEDCAVKINNGNSAAFVERKMPIHTSEELNCSTYKSDVHNPDSFSANALISENFKNTTVPQKNCPYETENNRQLEEHCRMSDDETENSELSITESRKVALCSDCSESSDELSILENVRNLYEEVESELGNVYLVKDYSPNQSNSFSAVLKNFKFNAPLSSAFSTSVASTLEICERNNDVLVSQKKYKENAQYMDEDTKVFNRNTNLNVHMTRNCQNVENHANNILQPIIGRIALLATDSCIAIADINGKKQHIYGLKSLFHCDKHEHSCDCFSALSLDDEVSCYIHFSEFTSEVWMAFMMSGECCHGLEEESLTKDVVSQNCQSYVPHQIQLNCVRNEKENDSNSFTQFFDESGQNETVSFHNGYKFHLTGDTKSSVDTVEISCQKHPGVCEESSQTEILSCNICEESSQTEILSCNICEESSQTEILSCNICEESSQTEILSCNSGSQTHPIDDPKLCMATNEVSCQIYPNFCDEMLQTEILTLTCDCQTDPVDQISSTEISCQTVFIQPTADASVQTDFRVQDCICQTDVSDDITVDTRTLKMPQTATLGCQTLATGDIMIKMYYQE